MSSFFNRLWYDNAYPFLKWIFSPLSLLYFLISLIRKLAYQYHVYKQYKAPVPVVVVGNITAGGAGKTPLTLWLAQQLAVNGVKVGIVSRGYGGKSDHYPLEVCANSSPAIVGDEPLLLKLRLGCPVYVDPKRSRAVDRMIQQHSVDLVICDDGLQHLALGRDFEIAVIDGQRKLGNGWMLPSGPLRELAGRLRSVDCIVYNGDADGSLSSENVVMRLNPGQLLPVQALGMSEHKSLQCIQLSKQTRVHAVAGIGNPMRFFDTVRALGFEVVEHAFDDHHQYTEDDLQFGDDLPVVMTEKDAVKCTGWTTENMWYLPVEAGLSKPINQDIISKLSLEKVGKHG